MRLTHLSLHNVRNFVRLDLDLPPGVIVLLGDNAQGKTNLLEAIYYLATSRSPHAGSDRELVNWLAVEQEPLPYARLVGRVARGASEVTLEITLTQQPNNGTRYRKQIRVNGVARRAMDLLGQLNAVLFLPEDITLISGSPSGRRRYLDAMLCQIDPPYCRALSRYNEVVTQRNALLRDLRERGGNPNQLVFWDERLVEHGATLVARRWEVLNELDELAHAVHGQLTDGVERLGLRYQPSVEIDGCAQGAVAAIGAAFASQLQALRRREIPAGVTLVGPHRDEVRFLIDDVDAGIYGSRGQQRTAALALKLAEVELMRRETGEHPVLLLDDVLSELDAHRRRFLVQWLDNGPPQAIITTTDLHILPEAFLHRCQLWRVQMGRLEEIRL
jgi:DNA replication and repair protein RecF